MEIRIGIERDLVKRDKFSPYFWIGHQGFTLPCAKKKKAKWTLKMLKLAFKNIPGVTIRKIKGTGFYGGI